VSRSFQNILHIGVNSFQSGYVHPQLGSIRHDYNTDDNDNEDDDDDDDDDDNDDDDDDERG